MATRNMDERMIACVWPVMEPTGEHRYGSLIPNQGQGVDKEEEESKTLQLTTESMIGPFVCMIEYGRVC